MIDFNKAKEAFEECLRDYDTNDGKINLKIVHTYHVVDYSEFIAKELGLEEEDIELAKLIALLHDIGRFEQIKQFAGYNEKGLNHAEYSYKILFENGLIRKFVEEEVYDNIIAKAVRIHSRYAIDEELLERELLHAKIIRDADKLDNFRVSKEEAFENMVSVDEEQISNEFISEAVYNDIMSQRLVLKSNAKTSLDFWLPTIAFTFDLNFDCSFKYLKETDYINIVIDRIIYTKDETKKRMEDIRKCVNDFIDSHI